MVADQLAPDRFYCGSRKLAPLSGRSSQLCIQANAGFLGIGPQIGGSPTAGYQGSLRPPAPQALAFHSDGGVCRDICLFPVSVIGVYSPLGGRGDACPGPLARKQEATASSPLRSGVRPDRGDRSDNWSRRQPVALPSSASPLRTGENVIHRRSRPSLLGCGIALSLARR